MMTGRQVALGSSQGSDQPPSHVVMGCLCKGNNMLKRLGAMLMNGTGQGPTAILQAQAAVLASWL